MWYDSPTAKLLKDSFYTHHKYLPANDRDVGWSGLRSKVGKSTLIFVVIVVSLSESRKKSLQYTALKSREVSIGILIF